MNSGQKDKLFKKKKELASVFLFHSLCSLTVIREIICFPPFFFFFLFSCFFCFFVAIFSFYLVFNTVLLFYWWWITVILFNFVFLFSLRVNLDMGKSAYGWMIMKDENIPGTVVRTSTIPEELGRLVYLLTDKTGSV